MTAAASEDLFETALADAVIHAGSAPLPDTAIAAAKQCILDWLGCALAGANEAPARALAGAFGGELGSGPCTVFTGPSMAHPSVAALINGTASHTIELDDIYSPALYHPGAPVIAAALAASQSVDGSGELLLRSVIVGYELSNRIGARINPDHYKFWHTTGTIGTLGAAFAAACALALTREQVAWSIGHAATMAAGLQQAFRSDGMTKPLHAGRAAEGGLLAARGARFGLTGSKGMISGALGLGRAMADVADWDGVLDDYFQAFTIEATTFKRFSACGHAFAAIDGALELVPTCRNDLATLSTITVSTYRKAIDVAGIARPASSFEAKFSIPFCVAAAVCGWDLTAPKTLERAIRDPAVMELAAKVRLETEPGLDRAFPKMRGAMVTFGFQDGRERRSVVPTRKGEPSNPLSHEELRAKFLRVTGDAWSPSVADRVARWVDCLDHAESVDPISTILLS